MRLSSAALSTMAAVMVVALAVFYLIGVRPRAKIAPNGDIKVVQGTGVALDGFSGANQAEPATGSTPGPQPRNVAAAVRDAVTVISPDIIVDALSCPTERCSVRGSISSPDDWQNGDGILKAIAGEPLERELAKRGLHKERIELNPVGDGIVIFDLSLKIND